MRKVSFVLFVWVNKPKCKNTTKKTKNIFSIPLLWHSIKRHSERIWNLKAFLNFYHWDDIKYPTVMNNNDYTYFKRKNQSKSNSYLHASVNFYDKSKFKKALFSNPTVVLLDL